tara:strand:- start:660 stop:2234 length:1575 start_codon:yes stop_codon:yes gene_type:complete
VAIVQISRIQHRRGVSENLPQLAVGEIGLAVDTKRVFIGNGGTDAPKIENIELLTASSDLLDSADTYTYKGAAAGYNAITGLTAASPITRTMQEKFDDVASVKDFGAKGDGATDDTAAINRALLQLFTRATNTSIRRALFFPAGTYVVTDVIKIPTFAKLVGDGHNSSIIKATSATPDCIAMTSDSLQQIDGSIGASGANLPGFIQIDGLTFHASVDTVDCFVVNQAQTVTFSNCRFQGFNVSAPTGVGNSQAGVKLESSGTRETEHINFLGCVFNSANFCVVADHDMSNITFSGCNFERAFKGVKIGEGRTGSAPAVDGPRGVKVTNSLFDTIYNRAIHGYFGPGLTSAFNTFKDCANNNLGSGSANTHVIEFARSGMHSVADDFERPDADVTTTKLRVKHTGVSLDETKLEVGSYARKFNADITLDDNSTKSSGITFSDNNSLENAIEIDYLITRGTAKRHGVLRITQDANGQVLDDDFSENNGTVGVTFNLTNSSNITTLNYVTTSTGSSASFKHTIRTIR